MNPEMIKQFLFFKKNFKGDAKAEVLKLIQSGQMTQAQLNQYQNMANQLQSMLPK